MRYIGVLRHHVVGNDLKTLLFVQMAARVIKNNLRLKLRLANNPVAFSRVCNPRLLFLSLATNREKMKEIRLVLQEPLVRVVIDYLNTVFGESAVSDEYWNKEVCLCPAKNSSTEAQMHEQNSRSARTSTRSLTWAFLKKRRALTFRSSVVWRASLTSQST